MDSGHGQRKKWSSMWRAERAPSPSPRCQINRRQLNKFQTEPEPQTNAKIRAPFCFCTQERTKMPGLFVSKFNQITPVTNPAICSLRFFLAILLSCLFLLLSGAFCAFVLSCSRALVLLCFLLSVLSVCACCACFHVCFCACFLCVLLCVLLCVFAFCARAFVFSNSKSAVGLRRH